MRAKQERDEFLRQVGITADGERTQTVSAPTEWTLEDDGEPDIDFPQPLLRHLVNYHNWLSDVTRAFRADPARFNTAVKRVVFATSWFDQKMKSVESRKSVLIWRIT